MSVSWNFNPETCSMASAILLPSASQMDWYCLVASLNFSDSGVKLSLKAACCAIEGTASASRAMKESRSIDKPPYLMRDRRVSPRRGHDASAPNVVVCGRPALSLDVAQRRRAGAHQLPVSGHFFTARAQ